MTPIVRLLTDLETVLRKQDEAWKLGPVSMLSVGCAAFIAIVLLALQALATIHEMAVMGS